MSHIFLMVIGYSVSERYYYEFGLADHLRVPPGIDWRPISKIPFVGRNEMEIGAAKTKIENI